jgi:hypothetical protein
MVGTPWKIVTRSRSRISSALPGSKRGIIDRVEPVYTEQFSEQVCPKEWNSGRAPSRTSSEAISARVPAAISTLRRRFEWVSSAPFGLPVVPDVYRITAVSWSSTSTTSRAGS